jgi:2-polyprenyl-3-methyl-5-hydroxy-6-metoxy-1,4-benzoquinol methylase
LFELGFGDGYYLRLMKDMGWECWGTELDLKIVEAHQSLGINAFTKLSDNEIPRNYFHWVTAYHVLEHVYDPVPTLEKMFKMLKHGGRIYISAFLTWTVLFPACFAAVGIILGFLFIRSSFRPRP